MGFVERQKSTIVLIKETGKFMNTGMTPVSKIHGGFVDCYESIIPNNLVEDIFVVGTTLFNSCQCEIMSL